LEDILFYLHINNAIPDWLVLFDEMVNEGKMKPKKVFTVLEIALSDIYGGDFTNVVITKLKTLRPLF
jgi:hypothetical protein